MEAIRNPKCKLCYLHKEAKHVCLMGVGPANAKLMFIGESPGDDEDREGVPFIGKSGDMLNSILIDEDVNINRDDVYISNLIKCHPSNNHKPNVETQSICSTAYLRKEIASIKPELIVCLGKMAAANLLQDQTIKLESVRNKIWYTRGPMPNGIPFIVTYHPGATFHQPHLLRFIVADLDWANRILTNPPKSIQKLIAKRYTNPKDIRSLGVKKLLEESKGWIDLDLETDGLDPFLPNRNILSVQLSFKEGEAYYFDWIPTIAAQLGILLRGGWVKGINGHAVKHDLKWLAVKAAGIRMDHILKLKVNDTIQNIHLIDENFPNKSLDVLASTFVGMKGHKDEFKKLIEQYVKQHKAKGEYIREARSRLWGSGFSTISISKRVAYGCGDADATGRLRRYFVPKIKEQGLQPLQQLINNCVKMYTEMEINGCRIDQPLLSTLRKRYDKKLDKLYGELHALSPVEINHASPQQVKGLIFGTWKLRLPYPVKVGHKKAWYTTSKDALELLLQGKIPYQQRKYIDTLLQFRKLDKLRGTYIEGMPKYLRDGYIHATWRLEGTETGRSSCSDPNLQQIPRKSDRYGFAGDVKQMFISRYKDGVLAQIDISQGELRWGAMVANEVNLLTLFNSGTTDIHRSTAARIFHKRERDVTDDERFKAKTVNFAIFYGGGAAVLAQEVGCTIEEAEDILDRWHQAFPGVKKYFEKVEQEIITKHYIRNLFGRYRRIFVLDPNSKEGMGAIRQATNSPIQGGLSDYVKHCGYRVYRKTRSDGCKVIMENHDAWVYDMRKHKVHEWAQIVKEEFEHADLSKYGFKLTVPMKVDISVGPNWKEMEPYGN